MNEKLLTESFVNAQPIKARESRSNEAKNDEQFDDSPVGPYSYSSGIVICCTNNTGEVLTQESFDDTGIHFIFSKSTSVCYSSNHDGLGIGSVVQIYWTRSFERVVRGSHIVVQIEKMDVYKCCSFIRENVFITFSSQSSPGIAIGVTERNLNVAFHPNCSTGARYETLRAHYEFRTEFQQSCKYKYRENINRMVEVIMASVPFKVEISGGIEKIHFVVLKKCGDVPGYGGDAVITKVVKNIFMEAIFIDTSEVVFFDSNSCHSNILDKVTVGSIISVLASPTFPSSCFRWYGYDVTMRSNHGSFKELDEKNIFVGCRKDSENVSSMNSAFKTISTMTKEQRIDDIDAVCSRKKSTLRLPTHSIHAQLKSRHTTTENFIPNTMLTSGKLEILEISEISADQENTNNLDAPKYSDSLVNTIKEALELHGLNKIDHKHRPVVHSQRSDVNYNDLRMKFSMIVDTDGFAVNQKAKLQYALPDQSWAPRERRFVGIFDDLQWILMGTFDSSLGDKEKEDSQINATKTGWWYRRIVPRVMPVGVIKEMETRRNVFKDCTQFD